MTARVDVITADGAVHQLDQLVQRGVEGITGLMKSPQKRGGNHLVPGEHGEKHRAGKRSGPASIVLPLWVRGVNPDGTIPVGADAGARLAFHANLRALLGLFTVDELVTIRHTLTDGSAREIVGEVTEAIDPTVRDSGRHTLGRASVALNCANPFWRDLSAVAASFTSAAPATLTAFVGISAPVEDLTITFGPQSNPRIEQTSSGIWMAIDRIIPAGQSIVVDTSNDPETGWTIRQEPTPATGLYEDLRYGGRGTSRWFALRPEPGGGTPIVHLTETAGGFGTCDITGKRTYKIA